MIIYLIGRFYGDLNMTAGKATSVLLYQRTVIMAMMGVNTNLVNIGKVWGSSYKCAKMIIAKKKVTWDGDSKIEKNEAGNFDVQDVKFSYPSKKDV